MLKLAQTGNMKLEEIRANLMGQSQEIAHKERALAVEVADAEKNRELAAKTKQPQPSSGGSIA
jgi:hypothetical protein